LPQFSFLPGETLEKKRKKKGKGVLSPIFYLVQVNQKWGKKRGGKKKRKKMLIVLLSH